MQGFYIAHQYANGRMGIVPHNASTKTTPACTTAAACNYTTDANIADGIGSAAGSSNAATSDVSEWALVTIALAGAIVLGVMFICYLLCPDMLGFSRKTNKAKYVLSHHDGTLLLRQANSPAETQQLQLVFLQ